MVFHPLLRDVRRGLPSHVDAAATTLCARCSLLVVAVPERVQMIELPPPDIELTRGTGVLKRLQCESLVVIALRAESNLELIPGRRAFVFPSKLWQNDALTFVSTGPWSSMEQARSCWTGS